MIDSNEVAVQFRVKVVEMSYAARAAHLASALSCVDIIAVLYHSILNVDPKKPQWEERDRFILSKGHAVTALYAALAYKGFIAEDDLCSYGKVGSVLEQHPSPKLPGVESATGSLGHGLPCACGMALAALIKGCKYRSFVLMGDGECNEGTVWEAAMFAAANRLGNLCAVIDFNKWQATGRSKEILAIDPLPEKFRSFGWDVYEVDGHDHQQLLHVMNKVSSGKQKPTMVVAHTVKGKGVSFMEDDNNWHYRIPTLEEVGLARDELESK